VYEKSISTKMNDLDLCLEVNRCITFHVEYLGNRYRYRLGSKELPIGNDIWAIEWSRDLLRHVTLKGQTRSTISRKLLEIETSNLVCSFVSGMPSGRKNNFP